MKWPGFVIGYADDTGSNEYNQALSEKRAQTDIPHNSINVRGKGASLATGDTDAERAMDRVVIIHVKGELVNPV